MIRIGTYDAAREFLDGADQCDLIGSKTFLRRVPAAALDLPGEDAYQVVLDTSALLTFASDQSVIYYAGPWGSPTARSRMNTLGARDVRVESDPEDPDGLIISVEGMTPVRFLGFSVRVMKDGEIRQLPKLKLEDV